MNTASTDLLPLTPVVMLVLAVGLAPLAAVVASAFTKVTVVLLIVRNALGIQQTPPNMILFAVAIVLTFHIMRPVTAEIARRIPLDELARLKPSEIARVANDGLEPMRNFMFEHSSPSSRAMFAQGPGQPGERDLGVLAPAFLLDELTGAFNLGFALYVPFLVIDLLVGVILIALGLQMVSATSIATPFKILLFVEASGWERLMNLLMNAYR